MRCCASLGTRLMVQTLIPTLPLSVHHVITTLVGIAKKVTTAMQHGRGTTRSLRAKKHSSWISRNLRQIIRTTMTLCSICRRSGTTSCVMVTYKLRSKRMLAEPWLMWISTGVTLVVLCTPPKQYMLMQTLQSMKVSWVPN